MGDCSGSEKKRGKKGDDDDDDGRQSRETARETPVQKSTGTKLKERWLMTRKTWRYMTDAGKRLFPEGTSPTRSSDIPKVQEHFQKTCCKSKEFILWPHHGSPSDDESSNLPQGSELEYAQSGPSGYKQSANIPIPRSRRRPGNILPPFNDPYDGNEEPSSLSLPCSPTRATFPQSGFLSPPIREKSLASELAWNLPPEIYAQLVRYYGNTTLQHVASRLLEEQLMEEDEYEYEEEEGVELLEIDGKRMRSIGAQTDSYLDMCVQTDHDDTAEDMVKVGAETRAETEAAFALSQAEKKEELERQQQKQSEHSIDVSPQRQKTKRKSLSQQFQPTVPVQPFQKETPVLKKFWGRRESKGTDLPIPQPPTSAEKSSRGLASEKDREAPPPKGGVAAKLASLEATNTPQPTPSEPLKQPPQQQIQKNVNPPLEKGTKPQEKKSLKSVFKLGLKCDVEASDAPKKNLEKQNADRFKTVNYDKTLRNIKTKWTKEDDELLMRMLAQQQIIEPIKELPKKKKRSKAIQVGEALPQFILTAFRVSSPVEIFHATRRRIRRRSSKAESTDFSGSEGSVSLASSVPTSPRYSFTVADDSGTRNLLMSEAEAMRLSQMGATIYGKRTSLDASLESGDSDRDGAQMLGHLRDLPAGASHVYQRSMSAHQVSSVAGLSALHAGAGRHGSGRFSSRQSFASSAATTRGHRASLLQYLLPAVMQRSRAGGSGHSSRLVAKRIWRTRSKSQSRASPATTSTWTPMGGNLWLSVTGAVVTLDSTSLLQLTELERLTLQQLALAKIASLNLGCPVTLPKESSSVSSSKKRKPYLLKRKALTTGFFDSKRDESKDSVPGSGGLVFGLSLAKCLENERLKQQQQQQQQGGAADLTSPVSNSAAGADGGLPEEPLTGTLSRKSSHTGSHGSFCSLAEGVKQSSTGSLESLNLDRKRPSLVSGDVLAAAGISELLHVDAPLSQVPALVTTCCNHLLNHGLHTVGIFRVSSSKKRVRQLREEFDQGGEVLLTEEHCPHDVATLLKEFFRDLPEPLLTRDLYEPFLCTQRIRNRKLKLEATQYLLQLLPPANRDTLCALLSFLTCVAEHAVDSVSDSGETIPGNMMDSRNLATMFAPNILHMHRAGADNASPAALAAMADERMDCTNVVRSMIDHNKELFEVSAELLDETYHHLMDTHPEALDVMLRRRSTLHDDRGQQLLQQLLASLLQPGRLPSSSPPYSPGHPGLEGDAESGSSVFDGSECSLSLPRSPTEHQEFERLRGAEDSEVLSRQRNPPADQAEERPDRRKYEDDGGKFSGGTEAHVEERGWFRRRDKSSSREFDKPLEEKQVERSRWFRRRDKASPRNSIDYGLRRKGSDKKKSEKPPKREEKISMKRRSSIDRGRGSGSDSADSRDQRQRSSSDQTVAQEKLRVPEESLRRLSSPEIDSCGVITASLKIPVPLQQQVVPTSSARESDIPFIEDSVLAEEVRTRRRDTSVNTSRPRTGSSDSYLGQPITGTMSFQPLCKKDIEKQSHDSVLSSSTDMLTLSPSPRNTPVSDVMIASETSSPLSRATSPPVMLSPDSGTPGLSPPPSPPPLLPRRTRRMDQPVTRSTPLSHSATHTFGTKAHIYSTTCTSSTKEKIAMQSGQPITRSRTAEVPSSTVMPSKDSKDSSAVSASSFVGSRTPSGVKVDVYNITGGLPRPSNTGDNSSENKKYTKRRGSNSKEGSLSTQQQTLIQQQQLQQYQSQQQVTHRQTLAPVSQQSQQPQRQPGTTDTMPAPQLWKRCEIIASDPSDPKARL